MRINKLYKTKRFNDTKLILWIEKDSLIRITLYKWKDSMFKIKLIVLLKDSCDTIKLYVEGKESTTKISILWRKNDSQKTRSKLIR